MNWDELTYRYRYPIPDGPWERTPWWIFWRPSWRCRVLRWDSEFAGVVMYPGWQYASPADFLTM